jgi:hypothetical protein
MRLLCATLALAMMTGLPAGRAETSKFDASKVRSLLDKDRSLPGKGRPRLTLSWVHNLLSHIAACWRLPSGVSNSDKFEMRVMVELNRDGTLVHNPIITEMTVHPRGAAIAKSVVDAIKLCQPYSFLPASEYVGGWDKLDMTFSPRDMFSPKDTMTR